MKKTPINKTKHICPWQQDISDLLVSAMQLSDRREQSGPWKHLTHSHPGRPTPLATLPGTRSRVQSSVVGGGMRIGSLKSGSPTGRTAATHAHMLPPTAS